MSRVTIHSGHPFLPPDDERRAVRQLRSRLPAGVSVIAAGSGDDRAGLTVSSLLFADGDPAVILALVDEESALWDSVRGTGLAAVTVLGWKHKAVADVFAGEAPSPGGPFRTGSWADTDWGPVLADCPGWVGCALRAEPRTAGWSQLLELVVQHVQLGADDAPLVHLRGRYVRPDSAPR